MSIQYFKVKEDVTIRENHLYKDEVYMKTNDIRDSSFEVIGYELLKEKSMKPKVVYLYLNEIEQNFNRTQATV